MLDFYAKGLEITGVAHRAGVKVLLGTDAGDSYVFPGFAVHDELQELVKAGLSPAEALRAATWESAVFLDRTADSGSLEPRKLADIVVLDADPLADIRSASRIHTVIFNGRALDRRALDQLLTDAATAAGRQK
jgi:imidazolonepropionase-like amidohydrolase